MPPPAAGVRAEIACFLDVDLTAVENASGRLGGGRMFDTAPVAKST
ncbi:hypothetical protein [Amycolatopsis sp. TNS106]|nr:hypothetical protein [Amycolatopsis sp. TNS106]